MLHVSGALRRILHVAFVADDLLQQLKSLVQVKARSRSDIEDFSSSLRGGSFRSQQVGGNDVINVGEIAALRAVAEDGRLLALQHLRDELGQHARIWRGRVLAGSKNVEVAQTDRLQAVTAVERFHVILAGQLCNRIWRNRIWRHAFMLGQRRSIWVRGRGGCVHHTFYFGVASGDKHMYRSVHVGAVASERIEHGLGHRWNGSFVEDVIHSATGFLHRVQLRQVGFTEIHLIQNLRDVFALPSREIIDATNFLAFRQDRARQRGTYEAGNSGDQVESHEFNIPNGNVGCGLPKVTERLRLSEIFAYHIARRDEFWCSAID